VANEQFVLVNFQLSLELDLKEMLMLLQQQYYSMVVNKDLQLD
jgi:hypothetical protein